MAAAQAAVKEKIVKLAEDTFCGPGDIEAQDAKSFHQYFMQTYPPDSAERNQLLSDLQGLENRLKALTGWVPPAAVGATSFQRWPDPNFCGCPLAAWACSCGFSQGPIHDYVYLKHCVIFFGQPISF